MANQLDSGIGYAARDLFSPGQGTPQHGSPSHGGIHMGIVVDDIDEQSMGRIWVYVPGVSARNPTLSIARYSPTRNPPAADGTPGTPIESMRSGFLRAYPLSPTAGSDKERESSNTPDGRTPAQGQSNSYGMFNQARNGDNLVVGFLSGDPSKCFVMGHAPKQAQTGMVPSYRPATASNATGAGYSTQVGPTYEKGIDTTFVSSSTLFNNLTDSGLISDSLRGLGSSSSTRETPSRVWGVKSPGDPDTNLMGHQLVMDDHPNSHLMRLRTSKGTQILLCDNGDFIYLSTNTGKTWIQLDDGGNVNIFGHSSISVHAEQDFNLSCDRDLNINVGGNTNWITTGDTRIRMNAGGNITVGEGGGDLDITTINNFHAKVQAEFRLNAKTGISATSATFVAVQSTDNTSIKAGKNFETDISGAITMKTAKAMLVQTTDDFSLKAGKAVNLKSAGGDFNMDTSANMNATKATLNIDDAKFTSGSKQPQGQIFARPIPRPVFADAAPTDKIPDTLPANQADIPLQHSVTAPPQTNGPPTAPTKMIKSAAAIVPQHEPWPGHPAQNPGFNGAVNPSSVPKLVSA
jgi:hypothetical protein